MYEVANKAVRAVAARSRDIGCTESPVVWCVPSVSSACHKPVCE